MEKTQSCVFVFFPYFQLRHNEGSNGDKKHNCTENSINNTYIFAIGLSASFYTMKSVWAVGI